MFMKRLFFILLLGCMYTTACKCQNYITLEQYTIENNSLQEVLSCKVLPYMKNNKLSPDNYRLLIIFTDRGYICISATLKQALGTNMKLKGYIDGDYDIFFKGNKYNLFLKQKYPLKKKKIIATGAPMKDGTIEWVYLVDSSSGSASPILKLYRFTDHW